MRKFFLSYILMAGILCSCSSDNKVLLPDGLHDTPVIGVYVEENQWIYTQMNHYYLWREDLPDSLSCDYVTDPVTFYEALLSHKDHFSYCFRNTDYTGTSEKKNYGFAYQEYEDSKNESFLQILYVHSKELRNKGLKRGDWLHCVSSDGQAAVFEKGVFDSDTFNVVDILSIGTSGGEQMHTTVYLDSIYTIKDAKIGYLCYLEYDAIADLERPLKKFYDEQIDELILDLRYNPGGYVHTCKYLCNSIVPVQGYGKIFQQCTYNDRLSQEYLKETGDSITQEFYISPTNDDLHVLGSKLYGLGMKKLYVLTSKNTASASEATILCLRPFMDIIVIGERTYGKGVGSWTISDKRYKYQLQPITMRYFNASMETIPDDGIPVNVEVPGGYETVKFELGDRDEPLLAIALECIEKGFTSLPNTICNTRAPHSHLIPIGEPSFFTDKK